MAQVADQNGKLVQLTRMLSEMRKYKAKLESGGGAGGEAGGGRSSSRNGAAAGQDGRGVFGDADVAAHVKEQARKIDELEADLEEKELDKSRAEGELEQSSRALGALNDLMYDMRQNQAELEDQLEATGAALQLSSDQKEQAQARLAEQEREISTLKAEHAELKRASKLLMMQTLNDVQARMN